jgi:hypothetical protein
MIRPSLRPDETDAPLLIDTDAVLPGSVTFQGLEAIIRWHGKISEHAGIIQHSQLSQSDPLNVLWQGSAERTAPDPFGFSAAKSDDHYLCITSCVIAWKSQSGISVAAMPCV